MTKPHANEQESARLKELVTQLPDNIDVQYDYYVRFGNISPTFKRILNHTILSRVKQGDYSREFVEECDEVLNPTKPMIKDLKTIVMIAIANRACRAGFGMSNISTNPTYNQKKKALKEREVLYCLLRYIEAETSCDQQIEVDKFYENPSLNTLVEKEGQKVEGFSNKVYLCQDLQTCQNWLEYKEPILSLYENLVPYLC